MLHEWGPSLLRTFDVCVDECEGVLPSLRHLGHRWLCSKDGPSPKAVRVPLLLFALRHEALRLSFKEATSTSTTGEETPSSLHWCAIASAHRHTLLGGSSRTLPVLELCPERWGLLRSSPEAAPNDDVNVAAEELFVPTAVSYTHLTLPTILRV